MRLHLPSSPDAFQPAVVFAALSDPTRLAILNRLRQGPCTVGQIVKSQALAGATITRHLDVLERARLIRRTRQAQEKHCSLDAVGFRQVASWAHLFDAFWSSSLANLDALVSGNQESINSASSSPDSKE